MITTKNGAAIPAASLRAQIALATENYLLDSGLGVICEECGRVVSKANAIHIGTLIHQWILIGPAGRAPMTDTYDLWLCDDCREDGGRADET